MIEINKFPLFLALLIQSTEFLYKVSCHVDKTTSGMGGFLLWVDANEKTIHAAFIILIAIFAFAILLRKNLFIFSAISLCTVLMVSWLQNSWLLLFLYPILIRHEKVSKINISQYVKSDQELFEDRFGAIIIASVLMFSLILMAFQVEIFATDWRYSLFSFGLINLFSILCFSIFIITFLFVFSISVFFKGSPNLTAKVSAMGLMSLVFLVNYHFLLAQLQLGDILEAQDVLLVSGMITAGIFLFFGEIKYDHSFSELLYSILSPIVQRGYWGKLFLFFISWKYLSWELSDTALPLSQLLSKSADAGFYLFLGWFSLGGAFQMTKSVLDTHSIKKVVTLCLILSFIPTFIFFDATWLAPKVQRHFQEDLVVRYVISAFR